MLENAQSAGAGLCGFGFLLGTHGDGSPMVSSQTGCGTTSPKKHANIEHGCRLPTDLQLQTSVVFFALYVYQPKHSSSGGLDWERVV